MFYIKDCIINTVISKQMIIHCSKTSYTLYKILIYSIIQLYINISYTQFKNFTNISRLQM